MFRTSTPIACKRCCSLARGSRARMNLEMLSQNTAGIPTLGATITLLRFLTQHGITPKSNPSLSQIS